MKRVIAGLMFVHRYLGLVFCLIFVIWFASGIVMVYKRMPEYSAEERLARHAGARTPAGFRTDARRRRSKPPGPAKRRAASMLTSIPGASRSTASSSTSAPSTVLRRRWQLLRRGGSRGGAGDCCTPRFRKVAAPSQYLAGLEEPDQWTINNRFEHERRAASHRTWRRRRHRGLYRGGDRRDRAEDRPLQPVLGLSRVP